jgi:cytochrome c peroxidase
MVDIGRFAPRIRQGGHGDLHVPAQRRRRDRAEHGSGPRDSHRQLRRPNRFKVPNLRGLAARAPYFHNGFAADLGAVLDFYDTRFHIGFTKQEKSNVVAFLRSL